MIDRGHVYALILSAMPMGCLFSSEEGLCVVESDSDARAAATNAECAKIEISGNFTTLESLRDLDHPADVLLSDTPRLVDLSDLKTLGFVRVGLAPALLEAHVTASLGLQVGPNLPTSELEVNLEGLNEGDLAQVHTESELRAIALKTDAESSEDVVVQVILENQPGGFNAEIARSLRLSLRFINSTPSLADLQQFSVSQIESIGFFDAPSESLTTLREYRAWLQDEGYTGDAVFPAGL